MVHIPTNISVYCHEERDLSTNRRIARRLLREKVELLLFGSQSKIAQRIEKLRERKQKASRRSKKKYHTDEKESNSNLDIDVDLDTASDDNERND